MSAPGLAVIGGSGALPGLILAARPDAHLVCIDGAGCTHDAAHMIPARFEQMGALFDAMRAADVAEVCFAGAMQRPPLDPSKLDAVTMAAAPKVMAAMQGGDDGLLRAVIALFEEHGFTVRGAHEIVPDLVIGAGALPGTPQDRLSRDNARDATRGAEILHALGEADVGQACVVAGGICFGVESIQGTDALLRFVADTRAGLRPERGGVLVKRAKPGQDLRVDMPTIGPATVDAAVRAGLEAIVLQAGCVLVVDRDEVVQRAAAAGLCIWGGP